MNSPRTHTRSRTRSLRSLFSFTGKQTRPDSPTFSDISDITPTQFGHNGPEKIITSHHLKTSLSAYDELMSTSASYRAALATMANATAAFADALQRCSGLKGPSYEAGTRMQAAAGLHHLMSNHWHVLAETVDKKFEKPLRQHLDTYRHIVNERSAKYEQALFEKSEIIRQTELRNTNRRDRNLQNFRQNLNLLQRQVDELDELKLSHYKEIADHEEEVWNVVQAKLCVHVRSTMDVFDRFTTKMSDPVIENMLLAVPDPFDAYGPPQSEDQIFSILPPLSIMASAASSTPSPLATTPEPEYSTIRASANNRSETWPPNSPPVQGFFVPDSDDTASGASTEWADVHSPSASPTPPGVMFPSVSPPRLASPQGKKSSKLKNVLSAIDENKKGRLRPDDIHVREPNGNDSESLSTPRPSGYFDRPKSSSSSSTTPKQESEPIPG